jgi:hypothetical protein
MQATAVPFHNHPNIRRYVAGAAGSIVRHSADRTQKRINKTVISRMWWQAVALLVDALCYKPEGRAFPIRSLIFF